MYREDELPNDFKLFFPLEQKTCVQEIVKEKSLEKVLEETSAAQTPTFDTSIKTSSMPDISALPHSSPSQHDEQTTLMLDEQIPETSLTQKETAIMQLEYETSIPSQTEIDVEATEKDDDENEKTLQKQMSGLYELATEMEGLELEEEWLQNGD